jgi:hypothetical protein
MKTSALKQESPQVADQAEALEAKFQRLAGTWRRATGHMSSMSSAANHPAYREIIAMGVVVVPLLLRDLEDNQSHWFIALRQITGADPIPPESAGNIP